MIEQLNDWGPLLTILVSLGALIIIYYQGLRTDLRALTQRMQTENQTLQTKLDAQNTRIDSLAERLATSHNELSSRLARIEAKLDIPVSANQE